MYNHFHCHNFNQNMDDTLCKQYFPINICNLKYLQFLSLSKLCNNEFNRDTKRHHLTQIASHDRISEGKIMSEIVNCLGLNFVYLWGRYAQGLSRKVASYVVNIVLCLLRDNSRHLCSLCFQGWSNWFRNEVARRCLKDFGVGFDL